MPSNFGLLSAALSALRGYGCNPMFSKTFNPLYLLGSAFVALTPLAGIQAAFPEPAQAESVLSKPPDMLSYQKPPEARTPREQQRMRLYGIRSTMLNPLVWAPLEGQRTHNNRIIPIKRYFLRDSERPDFRVKKISFQFHFSKATQEQIANAPHDIDPLLEIGFAGAIENKSLDAHEVGYALRLSAFPPIPSGIYSHTAGRYTLKSPAEKSIIATFGVHQVAIEFAADSVLVQVDGKKFTELRGTNMDRGMISLVASWHPCYVKHLEIIESLSVAGVEESKSVSGVVENGDVPQ